jgi:hypothetical protein
MGNGATRSLQRVAAAMGELESAPIEFQATCDVAQGGVLLALPALLASGLLRYTPEFYQLPKGFYGIESIFLLLGLMALARIRSLEQLRYQAPGEWGKLLGLDRIPEVRTLRAKLKLLCQDMGLAMRWNAALAQEWIARQNATDLYFYCDGHVRVYHGDQTALPRHYVARERLCLRATTDYWIHAMDGQPFLYVNKEVDPGLIATLKGDVIPWLAANVAKTPEQEQRLAEDPRAHWFTMVFDWEGYSPELFEQMRQKRIAILSYHKFPRGRLAEGRVRPVQRDTGRRRNRDHATGGARLAVVQQALVARDSQAHRHWASDLDSDDELSGADDDAGGVAIRQMESGKLLPLHARTLWPGPPDRVRNRAHS